MKNDGKNAMAEEAELTGPDDDTLDSDKGLPPAKLPPRGTTKVAGDGGGFFTIYKKGQGYWTRIGTVAGASLIALLTAQFIYSRGRVWFTHDVTVSGVVSNRPNMPVIYGIVAAFLAIFALVIYRIINRPNVVDFLIATDSEMKKVNWTTRAELIGSTKVVIIFMLLIAVLLFTFDTLFGAFFQFIHVLQFGPFD